MAGIFGLSGSGFSTGVISTTTPFTSLLSDGPKARATTFAVASALTLAAVTSGCGSTQQVAGDRHDQGCVQALAASERRAHQTELIELLLIPVALAGGLLLGFLGGTSFGLFLRDKASNLMTRIETWRANRNKS